MKRVIVVAVLVLMTLSAQAQKNKSEDISILGPGDPSYADAKNTASVLEARDLKITSIHRSTLEGFFRGVSKAAVFKTDKGVFQVIFFPEPKQAEKITVKEVREGNRFIYSFEGHPEPNPPGDVMNAAYKIFFIMNDKLFIVVAEDEKFYETLKAIFQ